MQVLVRTMLKSLSLPNRAWKSGSLSLPSFTRALFAAAVVPVAYPPFLLSLLLLLLLLLQKAAVKFSSAQLPRADRHIPQG